MPKTATKTTEAKTSAMPSSFAAVVTKHLNKIADVCETHNPDAKHNVGRGLGVVFFWTAVEKYAKAKKDEAWDALAKEDTIPVTNKLNPGEYMLAESPHFYASVKISNPIKRFDGDVLADALFSKYKVPKPMAKELIDQAKVPTSSSATKSVILR